MTREQIINCLNELYTAFPKWEEDMLVDDLLKINVQTKEEIQKHIDEYLTGIENSV